MGLRDLSFTDQPPWRFGSEEEDEEERDRPGPLYCERHSEGPDSSHELSFLENTSTNQVSDDPAQVDKARLSAIEARERCRLTW